MNLSKLWMVALVAAATAATGCGDGKDDETPTVPAAELIVTLNASDAVIAAAASYEVEVDGDSAAPSDDTAPTDDTDTTAAATAPTFSVAAVAAVDALDAPAVFTDVTPGLRTVTARALDADGNAVAAVEATVEVTTDAPAALILSLSLSGPDGENLVISGLSASNAAPRNHDVVSLSATVSGPTTEAVAYSWSDDCGGIFSDAAAAAPTWTNYWYGDCTLTLTARQGQRVAQQTLMLEVAVRPGSIERVAGNNGCGGYGDAVWWQEGGAPLVGEDGPATEARFTSPRGIEVGSDGRVVFAEREAGRVLAYDPETKLLHRLVGVHGGSYDNVDSGIGTATNYRLYWTYDVEEDSDGTWLIGDNWGGQFYRYYPNSGTIESLGADRVLGMALDGDGTVYYHGCGSVKRYYPADGTQATLDPTGTFDDNNWNGNNDGFYSGCGFDMEIAPDGTLYLANRGMHQVLRYDSRNSAVPATMVAGRYDGMSGDFADGAVAQVTSAEEGGLHAPSGIEVIANGDILVAEMSAGRIRRLTESAGGVTRATDVVRPGLNYVLGEPGPSNAPLESPWDVAADADGNLYVSETQACRISKVHDAL